MNLLDNGILCSCCKYVWRKPGKTPLGCVSCFAARLELERACRRREWTGFWKSIYTANSYGPHAVLADWLDESGFPLLAELMRGVVRKYAPELQASLEASAEET